MSGLSPLASAEPASCEWCVQEVPVRPAAIQLKDRHMPCKLYRKWKELLAEYTTAEYDTIQSGGQWVGLWLVCLVVCWCLCVVCAQVLCAGSCV